MRLRLTPSTSNYCQYFTVSAFWHQELLLHHISKMQVCTWTVIDQISASSPHWTYRLLGQMNVSFTTALFKTVFITEIQRKIKSESLGNTLHHYNQIKQRLEETGECCKTAGWITTSLTNYKWATWVNQTIIYDHLPAQVIVEVEGYSLYIKHFITWCIMLFVNQQVHLIYNIFFYKSTF